MRVAVSGCYNWQGTLICETVGQNVCLILQYFVMAAEFDNDRKVNRVAKPHRLQYTSLLR